LPSNFFYQIFLDFESFQRGIGIYIDQQTWPDGPSVNDFHISICSSPPLRLSLNFNTGSSQPGGCTERVVDL